MWPGYSLNTFGGNLISKLHCRWGKDQQHADLRILENLHSEIIMNQGRQTPYWESGGKEEFDLARKQPNVTFLPSLMLDFIYLR